MAWSPLSPPFFLLSSSILYAHLPSLILPFHLSSSPLFVEQVVILVPSISNYSMLSSDPRPSLLIPPALLSASPLPSRSRRPSRHFLALLPLRIA